eukprot:SAG31_NODE_10210_length_1170_cov_1.548086_1_plen_88_part_10
MDCWRQALAGAVDFLWYDQEHTPMAPEVLGLHILAAHSKGPTPTFVRIPGPNAAPGNDLSVPWGAWIKPILDMGADGVILPQVSRIES